MSSESSSSLGSFMDPNLVSYSSNNEFNILACSTSLASLGILSMSRPCPLLSLNLSKCQYGGPYEKQFLSHLFITQCELFYRQNFSLCIYLQSHHLYLFQFYLIQEKTFVVIEEIYDLFQSSHVHAP
ncbi:hypothetical protein BpHYR1_036996 [Brachionus plicatilis]|uniref:Uncharacterized protein n=1 Tax=Brachionus plicatilis TaxID=10195 RepID=A0A3M7SXG1_BRAPC|nr:hypothetical protein BpHYR1_036996 [Brachionus plicatilis]